MSRSVCLVVTQACVMYLQDWRFKPAFGEEMPELLVRVFLINEMVGDECAEGFYRE